MGLGICAFLLIVGLVMSMLGIFPNFALLMGTLVLIVLIILLVRRFKKPPHTGSGRMPGQMVQATWPPAPEALQRRPRAMPVAQTTRPRRKTTHDTTTDDWVDVDSDGGDGGD